MGDYRRGDVLRKKGDWLFSLGVPLVVVVIGNQRYSIFGNLI